MRLPVWCYLQTQVSILSYDYDKLPINILLISKVSFSEASKFLQLFNKDALLNGDLATFSEIATSGELESSLKVHEVKIIFFKVVKTLDGKINKNETCIGIITICCVGWSSR